MLPVEGPFHQIIARFHNLHICWRSGIFQLAVRLSKKCLDGLQAQGTYLSRVLRASGHCNCGGAKTIGAVCTQPQHLVKWMGDYGMAHVLQELVLAQGRDQTETETEPSVPTPPHTDAPNPPAERPLNQGIVHAD